MLVGMTKQHRAVALSESDQEQLSQWGQAHGTPQQVALRCRIVLGSAHGDSDLVLAKRLSVNRHTCRLWRERFSEQGINSLWEIAPGRGRKPNGPQHQRIIETTVGSKPRGQTHWSSRSLARALKTSHSTVQRVWQTHNLKPHLERTFKVSRDPQFLEKLTDVVGLYLNPPDRAVVLCVDEKSQIQALDRTQPGLPLKKGRCGTCTHDYNRHGTTSLFAALPVLEGKVIGQCYPRHRHQEFLKFLRRLDQEFPPELELHLILDNYCTHKNQKVQKWLEHHRRFKLHFIPTSSSWLNLVERWFRDLTQKALRRGSFRSVPVLLEAIDAYLESWNEQPRPFVWTASVESILKKINKCREALEKIQPGCTLPKQRRQAE
jgi:transposase